MLAVSVRMLCVAVPGEWLGPSLYPVTIGDSFCRNKCDQSERKGIWGFRSSGMWLCWGEWFLIVSSSLGFQWPKKLYFLGRWTAWHCVKWLLSCDTVSHDRSHRAAETDTAASPVCFIILFRQSVKHFQPTTLFQNIWFY